VRRALLLVLAVVMVAAGCGGGTKTYTLAKTRACLKAKGVRVTRAPRSDFVASTAPGGAFRAQLPGNFVTLVFAENDENGDQIVKAYQQFAFPNVKKGLADVLKRDSNVIRLWHQHPDPKDESIIRDCLK
jgi:hypothetical protein